MRSNVVKQKIINDPIYGFVSVSNPLIYEVIEHPLFQRLRRIKQLGLNDLVYPGAVHSRFHHALGAMHLMQKAIGVLLSKGVQINEEEQEAVLLAILLHDIGHGPFSHALERVLLPVSHERISLLLMQQLDRDFGGSLAMAIDIFRDSYPKRFLHQLVSGQLDMDRLDYLTRDSFYTGVSEGIVGLERIIQMLHVCQDQLVVEEKGIYSIEKFIVARRLMYWQVYLHKTTLAADAMLLNLLDRAKTMVRAGKSEVLSSSFGHFLEIDRSDFNENDLRQFVQLDDHDIMHAIKNWVSDEDPVLRHLSNGLLNRKLFKTTMFKSRPGDDVIDKCERQIIRDFAFIKDRTTARYLFHTGVVQNEAYDGQATGIHILMKDGSLRDIADASDNYNIAALKKGVEKFYLTAAK